MQKRPATGRSLPVFAVFAWERGPDALCLSVYDEVTVRKKGPLYLNRMSGNISRIPESVNKAPRRLIPLVEP